MNILKDENLLSINGGAVKTGVILAIAAIGAFVVGIVDGLIRPLRCNK